MKTKQIIIVFTLMAMTSLTSCQQDELLYSCDPEINSWVIEHKIEYANLSRDQLVKFDYLKQRGLFASFSPEQKVNIYQSKYQYLMDLNTLTKEEKEWLTILYQRVTPNIYSSQSDKNEFIDFSLIWAYKAMEKFSWERIDLYRYTHTWMTNDEFDLWIETVKNQKTSSPDSTRGDVEPELPCVCYWDISCLWAWQDCKKGKCVETEDGCGILGTNKCTGDCM